MRRCFFQLQTCYVQYHTKYSISSIISHRSSSRRSAFIDVIRWLNSYFDRHSLGLCKDVLENEYLCNILREIHIDKEQFVEILNGTVLYHRLSVFLPYLIIFIGRSYAGVMIKSTATKPQIKPLPTWWRHQMETVSALLSICAGNSPTSGEFPAQRPVTQSFDVFFDLV